MTRQYTPQEAYEEDCRRCPYYDDGTPRKSWDQLCDAAKDSWRNEPTPRDFKPPPKTRPPMTTSAIHQQFIMDIIAELTRSRRDNPGSAGHFNAMNEAMRLLANALTKESSECVREQCIQVAIAAIRIALDGCMSVEKARALQGLDHVTAHLQTRANEERAAH